MSKKKPQKNISKTAGPSIPDNTTMDKSIRVFTSYEEMEEKNARELASLSPEEHLRHATDLIKRIFSEELKEEFSVCQVFIK
ncbi:MAG: hypothetical protein H0X62_01290 [Bacteroidetes bacterium]|nr:hypothetical protein [Bacteroidota bacterium]